MASPLQFAYRTQKAIGVFDAAPVYASLPGFVKPEGNLRCCIYSPCGRYFAWASNEGVSVVDASTGQVLASLALTAVYELGFSPRGTFIATWERPSKDEAGDATKNLKIWRTIEPSTDEAAKLPLGQFVQKSQNGWNLQYTADEQYCARLVTNEVQFYDSNDLKTVWNKLRVEGVTDFALAPGSTHNLAVFVPERKVSKPWPQPHADRFPCHSVVSCLGLTLGNGNRANPPLSKCSTCPSLRAPSRKKPSSRVTRSSSSGTSRGPA